MCGPHSPSASSARTAAARHWYGVAAGRGRTTGDDQSAETGSTAPFTALSDITRRHRIAQHLLERARIDPKAARRLSLAQSLYHHRVAHSRVKFHSLHPPPFAAIRKGLSLLDFYSGATGQTGRFSEGLLLRRSHSAINGQWSTVQLGGKCSGHFVRLKPIAASTPKWPSRCQVAPI